MISDLFLNADSLPWEEAGEGVRRKILGFDSGLMMVYVEFRQGAVGYVHTHPHRQVTFVAAGTFEVQIGEEKRTLHAGDCYFIPPNVTHGVRTLEEGSLVDVFAPAREDMLKKPLTQGDHLAAGEASQ